MQNRKKKKAGANTRARPYLTSNRHGYLPKPASIKVRQMAFLT